MRRYEAIRPVLKTGDIVLFSGNGGLSGLIRLMTRSAWSHVGMVLRDAALDSVLVWESTTLSGLKDLDTGVARRGVQLVGLRERVMTYDGEIAVRRLSKPLAQAPLAKLGDLRSRVAGLPYERNMLELMRSALDALSPDNREDLSSLFCSELVAEAYQALGLLDGRKPSNEYVPGDFSRLAREPLRLKRGFALGGEDFIKLA